MIFANLFFENSTRTKFSFEIAALRLGAKVINFSPENSSISKGESLEDTLLTFDALGVNIAAIRHSDDNYIANLESKSSFSIINAGAGKKEHPTQSLLDLFTIYSEFNKLEGLNIAICGDIINSRVAKSNIEIFSRLKINLFLTGPDELLPSKDKLPNNCKLSKIDSIIGQMDVFIFLRIQHERHFDYDFDISNYNNDYGLNDERVSLMKNKSIFMHPGPVNRDVEISSNLISHNKSRIFKQKENGVYTRMAILEWIFNGQ